MDLSFVLMLLAVVFGSVGAVIFHQTVWKRHQRRELERRHHANKRGPVGR